MLLVPEGRRCFQNLTIEENFRMGAFNNDAKYEQLQERDVKLFPRLVSKGHQLSEL